MLASVTAASSTTAAGSERRDSGYAERDKGSASSGDFLETDALDVVVCDVLSRAVQAIFVDFLHFELQALTAGGDYFHTIVPVESLR